MMIIKFSSWFNAFKEYVESITVRMANIAFIYSTNVVDQNITFINDIEPPNVIQYAAMHYDWISEQWNGKNSYMNIIILSTIIIYKLNCRLFTIILYWLLIASDK